MTIKEAKQSLDKVINKSRVHLYKPIQSQYEETQNKHYFYNSASPTTNILLSIGESRKVY
jgi:hypothetical protein